MRRPRSIHQIITRLRLPLFAAALLLASTSFALSQKPRPKTSAPAPAKPAERQASPKELAEQAAKSRQELVEATKRYKTSLGELAGYHERNLARALERQGKMKELYAQGLVSKREYEESEKGVLEARVKVDETKASMKGAETLIAQTLEESKLAEQLAKAPRLATGSLVRTIAYVRYNGPANWQLSQANQVQSFFLGRFGRGLPVSAFGQTAVHNQLGFDHRNAMDVAVHPDSAEGQALMDYLRQTGIPFIAFRQAVSGSATGPHIHVGRPSHRLY